MKKRGIIVLIAAAAAVALLTGTAGAFGAPGDFVFDNSQNRQHRLDLNKTVQGTVTTNTVTHFGTDLPSSITFHLPGQGNLDKAHVLANATKQSSGFDPGTSLTPRPFDGPAADGSAAFPCTTGNPPSPTPCQAVPGGSNATPIDKDADIVGNLQAVLDLRGSGDSPPGPGPDNCSAMTNETINLPMFWNDPWSGAGFKGANGAIKTAEFQIPTTVATIFLNVVRVNSDKDSLGHLVPGEEPGLHYDIQASLGLLALVACPGTTLDATVTLAGNTGKSFDATHNAPFLDPSYYGIHAASSAVGATDIFVGSAQPLPAGCNVAGPCTYPFLMVVSSPIIGATESRYIVANLGSCGAGCTHWQINPTTPLAFAHGAGAPSAVNPTGTVDLADFADGFPQVNLPVNPSTGSPDPSFAYATQLLQPATALVSSKICVANTGTPPAKPFPATIDPGTGSAENVTVNSWSNVTTSSPCTAATPGRIFSLAAKVTMSHSAGANVIVLRYLQKNPKVTSAQLPAGQSYHACVDYQEVGPPFGTQHACSGAPFYSVT